MHFIDRHRAVPMIRRGALFKPGVVRPRKIAFRRQAARRVGAKRAAPRIRVGFENPLFVTGADGILIIRTLVGAVQMHMPKPVFVDARHRTAHIIPVVEIADDADFQRVGRPNHEIPASVFSVRTHKSVALGVRSFEKQIGIQFADRPANVAHTLLRKMFYAAIIT